MVKILSIENDMRCDAALWYFDNRRVRLVLSARSPDFSNADAAIQSLRGDLERLPFSELKVDLDKDQNALTVGGDFCLPLLFQNRRVEQILTSAFAAFNRHVVPLMEMQDDPVLGRLVWNNRWSCWTTQIELDGETVPLHLEDWGRRDLSETIRNARELIDNWGRWRQLIQEAQVSDLLELYNDEWREEGLPPIDADELRNRLTLGSIDCEDNGWRTCNYYQDELFTDHDIEMRISPEGKVEAVLAG